MTEISELHSSNSESKTYKFLGQRIPLHDGIQRLQGEMPYTGDLEFAGMLHLRLVISPHAHAKIISMQKELECNNNCNATIIAMQK